MASSYTGNSGIEKPAEGDQTGEWGDTINLNMDIIDRAINGVGAITLSGTTHTLTTTDGTLSDGMYKVLVLGGSPSGTNTITIAPNDADKVYIVVNSSGQTATFTQGSGANVSVLNGDSKIIYADGAGSGAAVVDITANLSFSSVNIDGGTIDGTAIGGAVPAAGAFTSLTVGDAAISEAELEMLDGITAGTVAASKAVVVDANKDIASFRNITLTGELDAGSLDVSGDVDVDGTLETDALSIASTLVTSTAAELNILDGVTSTTAELNILDGVTSTAAELNILDGVTSTAAELNILDGVTSTAAELNYNDTGAAVGTVVASKTVTVDANKDAASFRNITLTGELDAGSLDVSGDADIDGTLETDALSINGTVVSSTAAELNILDGVTSTTAELNILDGVTSTAAELNILDGVTSTAAELNILDGVTSTAAELNILDGVTSTAAELNYLDITTLGTSEASKAVTVDASGDLLVPDSDKFKFGAGSDMQVYHDGTDSYVTNATGELKLATESSGIAIAIGHSTSEVTFGDNVTITGDLAVNGTTTTINTTNLTVTDPLVKFGQAYTGSAYDEGFIVTRGDGSSSNTANKGLIWDESADEFAAIACNTEDGTTAGNVTINSYADLQVGKLTGASLDISGDVDVDGTLETDALSIASTVVTSTAAELNILDGVTSTAAELNILDGVTSTAAELNILDGVTSTAAELNYLDITTLGTSQASKAVTADANGDVLFPDGDKVRLGAGADLVLQHDGSHSYIQNITGNLNLQGKAGEDGIVLVPDGAVTLYYDNAAKLATASGGVTVTGGITVSDAGTIGSASDTDAIAISSAGLVSLSATNALKLNAGTTAQRPTGAAGHIRYNSTLSQFEGYGSAWGSLGGGATGGGSDTVFVENSDDVTTSYTITSGKNAMSVGPITVEAGVVVTIPSGSRWVIL
jgi:cytoskeletal protein CcmA (bactofilin family)